MYGNQHKEAVLLPAVYSLRRMTHQDLNTSGSKGSYEMYDPQQTSLGSLGEKRLNGINGSAPGSPGTVLEYKQVVVNLQKELEESRRKGAELQQILSDLNSDTAQINGHDPDDQFHEGSPSSGTLGESVKDAYIKHLQRQVTVLQASLHKTDGWANRVGISMKERDQAVDDLARLTNQIKDLEADNQQMQQKIEYLSTALQESKQNLQQVTGELQRLPNNGQQVAQLQEEVQRQKFEIAKLTQSIAQLDQENKSLKDSGFAGSNQSLGNMACSQELEHLHVVVDKLKSIVLEQRSYLLQLKKPNNLRNAKSLSSPSGDGNPGGGSQDPATERKQLSSPTLRLSGNEMALPQKSGLMQLNQAAGLKPAATKENLQDPSRINLGVPGFKQLETGAYRRTINSQEMLEQAFNFSDLGLQQPFLSPEFVASEQNNVGGTNFLAETIYRKSPEHFGQNGSGDMTDKNMGQAAVSQQSAIKSPIHRATKSEVVAQRHGQEQALPANWGSKSEIINLPTWNWNGAAENRSPTLTYKPGGNDLDKYVEMSPGAGYRLNPQKPGQKEGVEITRNSGSASETQRQMVGSSGTMQMIQNNSSAVPYENINRNSPTFQRQFIYQPPSGSQQGHTVSDAVRSKQATPRPPVPCGVSHRPSQDVVYVNTSSVQSINVHNPSSSVDPDSSRAKQNSDKLCPVCSHDYSQLSIEEFQTHVLDCFDDDHPPETMKPDSSPQRLCPMCSQTFGPQTSQTEFEKHVHSHFGEEFVGEHFEILH